MQVLRRALRDAVAPEDIVIVIRALVRLARGGNVQAAKLVLDRCLGRVPFPVVEIDPDDFYNPDEQFL